MKENPSVEKVVIVDAVQRCDPAVNDPFGMKPQLAKYSNEVQREILARSELKDKIHIENHTVTCNESTFGSSESKHFDGIHLYGSRGREEFTASLVKILSNVLSIRNSTERVFRENFPRAKPARTSTTENKHYDNSASPQAQSTDKTSDVLQYAVKTFNRFSSFLY